MASSPRNGTADVSACFQEKTGEPVEIHSCELVSIRGSRKKHRAIIAELLHCFFSAALRVFANSAFPFFATFVGYSLLDKITLTFCRAIV